MSVNQVEEYYILIESIPMSDDNVYKIKEHLSISGFTEVTDYTFKTGNTFLNVGNIFDKEEAEYLEREILSIISGAG